VAELDRFDRLLEVGSGDRLDVAGDLAARGHDVVAVDVAVDDDHDVAGPVDADGAGSLRVRHGDVVALADATDPASALGVGSGPGTGIDAVYARRLPAELHRPTVDLATRLEAACLFTTLGFEEPVVPVRRRSLPATTLYVARTDTTRAP
jgi:uncharacterized UPF0146 family protein